MTHTPNPLAKRYYDLGGKLFEESKHEEAIACYTKAIEEDGEYGSAYFNRALSFAFLSKYREAARDAETVMRLEPESYDGPYVLGVICEYQEDYEGALDWYRKSLDKNPCYRTAKERLKGLEEKMKLVSLDPALGNDGGKEDEEEDTFDSDDDDEEDGEDRKFKVGRTLIVDGQIKGLGLKRPRKKMEDVVGLEDVKRELELSVIGPARRPEGMKRWNVDGGLSVLLYGPSGCGKTHLVEAMAGEIGAYPLVFNLNEVVDMYSGNTEKNIHAIFQKARGLLARGEVGRIVVFIDELDAVGMNRAMDRDSASGRRAAINQLLVELDGLERNPAGLIVVGATNRPWDIDPALKRSGRFGDEWYVEVPSQAERRRLFEFYLRSAPTGEIDYGGLARRTRIYSPADIKRVVRTAKLRAMQREGSSGKETVLTTEDLVEAIESNQASSLYGWFLDMGEEFSSKRLDRTRYRRLVEDMAAILGRRATERKGEGDERATGTRSRRRQQIPAYA